MREIKFRAWDKKRCRMFDVESIDFIHRSCLCDDMDSTVIVYLDDAILLEYTGLKDKNEKEIYDGDFIGDDRFFINVIFKDGMFVSNIDFSPIIEFIYSRKRKGIETEIIGNIHENPELLKESK